MAKLVYPLEQILHIKEKRVEEALKNVQEKENALEHEREILAQKEAERDKVLNHHSDKLRQLRETLDKGSTSPKIQQMKVYIKIVKENLAVEEKKVQDQQEQVDIAKTNLEVAQEELRQRRKEVDKLQEHKKEWTKVAKKEQAIEEERELDEMGSIMFLTQMRKKK